MSPAAPQPLWLSPPRAPLALGNTCNFISNCCHPSSQLHKAWTANTSLNSFSHLTQTSPTFFCGFRLQLLLSDARNYCQQLAKHHPRHTSAPSKMPQWFTDAHSHLIVCLFIKQIPLNHNERTYINQMFYWSAHLVLSFIFLYDDIKYQPSTLPLWDFPFPLGISGRHGFHFGPSLLCVV